MALKASSAEATLSPTPDDRGVKTQGKTSGIQTYWQQTYGALGFAKGYNFPLFIITAGAMLGFSLARVQYLDVSGHFANGASPGEWYWYRGGHYRVGISMHLGCILPAGLLLIWQFVPIIRHKFLLFHRINGYIVILLTLISNAGALMIVRRSFGGTLATQAAIGVLVIGSTVAIALAYYNIRRLQVDQHRAWMLRAMIWMGSIITSRIIFLISAVIVTRMGDYYGTSTCDEILFLYRGAKEPVIAQYPACAEESLMLSSAPNKHSLSQAVHANFNSGAPEQIGASLDISFSSGIWLAIILHFVGTELYLWLTPAESYRLRNVSYQKQLEAGFARPGSSGLTVQQLGDALEWKPEGGI